METEHIPRAEWEVLFDRLRQDYAGRSVSIETSCWETCSIYQRARELPLLDVCVHALERPLETVISITVGEDHEDATSHSVARPSHIALERAESGKPAMLRIESEDSIFTTIVLHAPVSAAGP